MKVNALENTSPQHDYGSLHHGRALHVSIVEISSVSAYLVVRIFS